MGYPSNRGGFEKDMSLFLDNDADVERFLKISESQHAFATIFYLREDGLLASYHPDFIVCTKFFQNLIDKNVLKILHPEKVLHHHPLFPHFPISILLGLFHKTTFQKTDFCT